MSRAHVVAAASLRAKLPGMGHEQLHSRTSPLTAVMGRDQAPVVKHMDIY